MFKGSINQAYKQIGNTVPVNLGYAMGKEMIRTLNEFTIREELKVRFKESA